VRNPEEYPGNFISSNAAGIIVHQQRAKKQQMQQATVGGTNQTPVSPRPKTQQKITPAKASCPY